jgi:hypothetical protein
MRRMATMIGVLLILPSCGGNGSDSAGPSVSAQGGGPAFSTSVPGDLTLGALSDVQNQQLCADTKAFYDAQGAASKADVCVRVGINAALATMAPTDPEARSTCQSAHDKCVAQPVAPSNIKCDHLDAACLATVTEYKACLQDAIAVVARQLDSLPSCQSLNTSSLPSLGAGGAGPSPTSCTSLVQKCPQAATP